jgi:hypothetical protein
MTQKAFSLVLQDLRDGRTHSELTVGMKELLAAVRDTGKAGTITLELKVKPTARGNEVSKVVITDKVTIKAPKPERGDDYFFVTDDDNLSRNHPRQHSLDLREAGGGKPTELKEAIQ